MMNKTTLRTGALLFVGVLLAALLGWYLFLARKTDTTQLIDQARGFGESVPLFPDDSGSTFANISSGVPPASETPGVEAPRLWHVTSVPVAGMGFVGSTTPELYFVERSTGYLFRADPLVSAVRRLTNTLFAKTYEALVAPSGRTILRGLYENGQLLTLSGSASSTTASANEFISKELPPQMSALALSPDGREIFYILPDGASGYAGVRSQIDGTAPKKVFTSSLSNWRAQWTAGDGITLSQKAASDLESSAYTLSDSGELAPLIRRVEGLLVLPDPRSDALVYSSSGDGTVSLYAQASKTASAVRLPLLTIAEKCVWSTLEAGIAFCAVPKTLPPGAFLDNWYRGSVHTSDSWWKVNAKNGTVEELFGGDEPGALPDVTSPVIHPKGLYIAFKDARDESLWLFKTQ